MGMTDSRSARSTPILSAPTNPAHPAQPEAPESRVPHHSEGHRADLKVGLRVGYNKWAVPARAKEILPIGNELLHCGRKMFGLTSRLLLCFNRLIME